jgi:hypothetical protein
MKLVLQIACGILLALATAKGGEYVIASVTEFSRTLYLFSRYGD